MYRYWNYRGKTFLSSLKIPSSSVQLGPLEAFITWGIWIKHRHTLWVSITLKLIWKMQIFVEEASVHLLPYMKLYVAARIFIITVCGIPAEEARSSHVFSFPSVQLLRESWCRIDPSGLCPGQRERGKSNPGPFPHQRSFRNQIQSLLPHRLYGFSSAKTAVPQW